MFVASYIHTLDPFALQITDTFGIRWYGLAYIVAFIIAWLLIRWMGKNALSPIIPNRSGDFIFAGVLGVLIGGRFGYCLFYDPSLLYTFSESFPWWRALAIQDGGMASHGGMLGVLVAFIIWGKRNNVPILHLIDIASFVALPGLFFGRLANFVNGELWGKSLPDSYQTNPPFWSIKYPTEITEVWLQNPSEYQEKLLQLEPLRTTVIGGDSFHHAIIEEVYKGNNQVIDHVQPLLTAWYPSQLFQAFAEGPVLFIALCVVWWKPRKTGVIASFFLILYGLARVMTEMYRQPDEGVETLLSLSRGQVLSLAMILSGAILLLLTTKNKSPKVGGFKKVFSTGL